MVARLEIYKCSICGNIVEVVHAGKGTLVCCGEPMILQVENTVDAAKEKHVPVVERTGNKVTVKVGSMAHPMEDKHYIEWIQVIDGEKAYRTFLKPGQSPTATFTVEGNSIAAREYCNIHGLWKG
ncbi:desulfoferrodoxin [bacterium]|nr:desulfoferrodoxin [bacterium]